MLRMPLIILYMLLISSQGYSQLEFNLQSKVLDNDFKSIGGAYLKNARTGSFSITDSSGFASLMVREGDSVIISAMGYGLELIIVESSAPVTVSMKRISFQLDEVVVYEFKEWEAFKKDFLELELPETKVNIRGIPNSTYVNPIPVKYRSNEFTRPPPAFVYVLSPVSAIAYAVNSEEKQKRLVLKQIQREKQERVYREVMQAEVIKELIPIKDDEITAFIIYCHQKVENKRLSDEYLYKEMLGDLWEEYLKIEDR